MSFVRTPHCLTRAFALFLCVALIGIGCRSGPAPIAPIAGSFAYQEPLRLAFRDGELNLAGGAWATRRVDFSLDTRIGTYELGAVHDSLSGSWRWSHELFFDGHRFVDASGAEHDADGLAPGENLPGSVWQLGAAGANEIRSHGGLVHEFAPGGELAAIHWADGEYPRLVFSSDGIDQCTAAGGCTSQFAFTRDAEGRITAISDRAGRSAQYQYDAFGRLTRVLDPHSLEAGLPGTRYEYALYGGRVTAVVSPDDERIEYDYVAGRLRRIRPIGGALPVYLFQYGREGDSEIYWTRVTNPLGAPCLFRYDGDRRLLDMENAVGERTLRTWQGRELRSITQPSGGVTSRSEDLTGETWVSPLGNVTLVAWQPGGVNRADPWRRAFASVVDSIGVVEERSYDAQGRLVSRRDGSGAETTFAWGSDNEIVSTTTPGGLTTQFLLHGEDGHPRFLTSTGEIEPGWQVQPEYDAVGNLTRGADFLERYAPGRPGIVERRFDARRRIEHIHVAAEYVSTASGYPFLGYQPIEVVSIERRSDGQPERILRPYGADSEFGYDALGRLIERRDRIDGQWVVAVSLGYDAAGNLVQATRANGMGEQVDYDALNRPIAIHHLRDGIVEQSATAIAYSAGMPVSRFDSVHAATETVDYDVEGRPVRVTYPRGEILERDYDLRGREIERRYWFPAQAGGHSLLRTIGREYDVAGRPTRVLEDGNAVIERSFENGALVQVDTANGLTRDFTRDGLGRVVTSGTLDAGGTQVAATYMARVACDITIQTCENATQWAGDPSIRRDEAYLLTSHEQEGIAASSSGGRVVRWNSSPLTEPRSVYHDFDLLGNRSAFVRETDWNVWERTDFTFNSDHTRVLEADGVSYATDPAGFVVERAGVALSWDAAGRLVGHGSDQFVWDTAGRPVQQSVGGVTTTAFFDGEVRGDAAGVPLSLEVGSELEIDLASGARLYRHLDFRGNVGFVSDDAGDVVLSLQYGPTHLESAAGPASDRRSFAQGEELGGELVRLGARVLDTRIGRFLSPDPEYDWINSHSYAQGNPVWLADFDGRHPNPSQVQAGQALIATGGVFVMAGGATGNATFVFAGMLMAIVGLVFAASQPGEMHARGPAHAAERFAGGVRKCPVAKSAGPVATAADC